jgi:hypothetical protein
MGMVLDTSSDRSCYGNCRKKSDSKSDGEQHAA